ncbi:hypothetical protein ET475_09615 [Microbacterium protaetiae]|uniref:Nuclear transport factor 2 family protein n=1 Tax=Microbacterium protaetiae TaxID=2509458 RepID=A0A4P6EGD2_9MICO|nr:hypothetical protein [Microbacterium protaetiae]QAY60219.1 hypothetical protein ET475_09615 [Microbacterium protaetiae]
MFRRLVLVATLACAGVLLAGCAPEPDPTPSPTAPFASEAEAFAAAEKTYRAYVDALNNVDLSDPATFEDLYVWETGDALATDKEAFTTMHADGWTMNGTTVVTLIQPADTAMGTALELRVNACADVSDVTIEDGEGASMVDQDRGNMQSLLITFNRSTSTPTGWAIAQVDGREEGPSCESSS